MAGPGETFQNQGSWKVGKGYFKIGLCKYSSASSTYAFSPPMYKHYIAFNSSKRT